MFLRLMEFELIFPLKRIFFSMDSRSSEVYCSRFRVVKNNWDCAIVKRVKFVNCERRG